MGSLDSVSLGLFQSQEDAHIKNSGQSPGESMFSPQETHSGYLWSERTSEQTGEVWSPVPSSSCQEAGERHQALHPPPCGPESLGTICLGWSSRKRPLPGEEEMATRFSVLAWKIPWTEEPGKLQFIGSQRVGHD